MNILLQRTTEGANMASTFFLNEPVSSLGSFAYKAIFSYTPIHLLSPGWLAENKCRFSALTLFEKATLGAKVSLINSLFATTFFITFLVLFPRFFDFIIKSHPNPHSLKTKLNNMVDRLTNASDKKKQIKLLQKSIICLFNPVCATLIHQFLIQNSFIYLQQMLLYTASKSLPNSSIIQIVRSPITRLVLSQLASAKVCCYFERENDHNDRSIFLDALLFSSPNSILYETTGSLVTPLAYSYIQSVFTHFIKPSLEQPFENQAIEAMLNTKNRLQLLDSND